MKRFYHALFLALFSVLTFSGFAKNTSDSSGYYPSFDGGKIYYEVKGAGYPVLLVHGFIMTGEGWKKTEVYKRLQEAGYSTLR